MKRGQVYYADFGKITGSEQAGKRPCVIVQNDDGNGCSPTVVVVPMTGKNKNPLPTHVETTKEDKNLFIGSVILTEQIQTIDKNKIGYFVCNLSKNTMKKVDEALHISLALNDGERKELQQLDELQIFENSEFGDIRTITVDGEPWFVASDICKALGLLNPTMAMQRIDSDEKAKFNLGVHDSDGTNCVNEFGLYSLILASRKKEANAFKRWITHEVIPSIRKTGGYQKQLSPVEMMRIQLGMIDNLGDRVTALENTTTLDHGQQRVLENTVNKTVISVLGGKESNAYKEIGRKVFAECNKDLKDHFKVNSRDDVPKIHYEDAIKYAEEWKPCTDTAMLIEQCNAQMNII